jgi:hypothetical protein
VFFGQPRGWPVPERVFVVKGRLGGLFFVWGWTLSRQSGGFVFVKLG